MHIGCRLMIGVSAVLGLGSPVLAEGFFDVSVIAEDIEDWPTVRLLLGVHDRAATPLYSEGWDIGGTDRYAHGLGPVPVRTFTPEPTEDRFCPERDPETGRRVCWMIEMTHEGEELAEIRQISLPMLRNLQLLYLWVEYDVSGIKHPPVHDAPHEITIYLESVQGNRTRAQHPPLSLYGTSVEFSLADGPWAHLHSETEKVVTWMIDGYAEQAGSSEHEALLYDAHARWEESRNADCGYRTHFVPRPEQRDALWSECMYEHAVLRLETYGRLVEGQGW